MKFIIPPGRDFAFYNDGDNTFVLTKDGRMIMLDNKNDLHPVILQPSLVGEYPYWTLMLRSGPTHVSCHRIMAETFLPNPTHLPVVNHKDGNKLNWKLSNLEWCTQQYNVNHAHAMGLTHATPQDKVVTIRKLHSEGRSIQAISIETGVKYQTVWDIVHNKRHVATTL